MAPGTHSGGNRVNFSFDDRFPMMSSPENDQLDAYGDDSTDLFVFETTYGENDVEDDKDCHYYYRPSSLEPSRGRGGDYPGSPTPRIPATQERRNDRSRDNVHTCQQLRPDVNSGGGGGGGGGWEKLYSCRSQYVHDDDSLPKRTPGNLANHRRRLEEVVPNQAEADTEQYIHRCPFARCSHHRINVTRTDFVDLLQPSGQDTVKTDHLKQDNARTGSSSRVRGHLSESNGDNFNICSNTAPLLGETRMHMDSSGSVDGYHADTVARSSSLPPRYEPTPPLSSPAGPVSSWQTTTKAPLHQKSLPNYNNNNVCYQDKYYTDCHLQDTTTLRQDPGKQEGTKTRHRLHPKGISFKEGLPSTMMLESINCGAAAHGKEDTCQTFAEAFGCSSPVHCPHNIGHNTGLAHGRHPTFASNIPGANEEADLQGYVRRDFVDVFSRAPPPVYDGHGIEASSLYQDDNLTNETEQEVNDIVKQKEWAPTTHCVASSTVKQQVTPGLRRRAIEYIVQQLGGGIKRTSLTTPTTETTMKTNNNHPDDSLPTILNNTNNTEFTAMTLNRTTSVVSSRGRNNTTTHSTTTSSLSLFTTQEQPPRLSTQHSTLHGTKALFEDSKTTAATSSSQQQQIPGSSTEGDSPALRRLYRTVERLEETVFAAANAEKEDYMKTLASKLAIIYDELKQHNSMQLPLPPSSSSLLPVIASTPHTISSSVTAAPPILHSTRHHTLPTGPRQTSSNGGVFICELTSRSKSLSEGDAFGQPRNSESNNNIFTGPDDVWAQPRHERPSSCHI